MKKKVIIFGKGGQLGFDLLRIFKNEYIVLGFDRTQVDVTHAEAVSQIIQREKPGFVINATAYNKVEQAEAEKELAFSINARAVENLARASESIGAVFVHVSTDYVFDGTKEFFTEEDEPKPLGAYGQSKLEGERLAQNISSKLYLIRTSAVFGVKEGSQKKNFVDIIISKAKEGQEIKIVNDQITSPTYSLDLAAKIKELLEKPAPFGTYHIANSGSCSWYELGKKALEIMNLSAIIIPIITEQSGAKVTRPKKSVLKNGGLIREGFVAMPAWQDALGRYLQEKYQENLGK